MADAAKHAAAVAERLPYYRKRVALFEQFAARAAAALEVARSRAEPLVITLPDGSVRAGVRWVTTPADVAAGISKGLAGALAVATVDGAVWDAFRPLEGDCALKLCTFDDPEGRDVRGRGGGWTSALALQPRASPGGLTRPPARPPRDAPQTFWHSSAHVLGEVLELQFGCDLTIGPNIEEGAPPRPRARAAARTCSLWRPVPRRSGVVPRSAWISSPPHPTTPPRLLLRLLPGRAVAD